MAPNQNRWVEIAVRELPAQLGKYDPPETFGLVPATWESRNSNGTKSIAEKTVNDPKLLDDVCDTLVTGYMPTYSRRRLVMALWEKGETTPRLIAILRSEAKLWLEQGV